MGEARCCGCTEGLLTPFELFLREHLPPLTGTGPPARLLEVGCGQGELTTALAVAGYDVLGIDPAAPHGELFRRVTLGELDEPGPYDGVIAAFSLHHIRDLEAALDKAASLLVPDGVLVVDEFAWDRLDEPTLEWLWEQRRALSAAGNGEEPGSLEAVREEWEADHLGLHGEELLLRGLSARFVEQAFEWTPFLYRLLAGGASEVLEQSLVDSGAIRALGFRYAGRPVRPARRSESYPRWRSALPESGMPTRPNQGSGTGKRRPDRGEARRHPPSAEAHPMSTLTITTERLSATEAETLWRNWKQRGDVRSRDRLVISYALMVRYLATRKLRELPAHCALDDLASSGLVALLEAVDRFDPAKGASFEQYAWTRVSGALVDELRRQDWASRSVRRTGKRIERAQDSFFARFGAMPTEDELARELGLTVEELRTALEAIDRADVGSLNAPARGTDDSLPVEVGETVAALSEAYAPEPNALASERNAAMREAVAKLSERERRVLSLVHVQELPGAEIGRLLGVTESRISQILSGVREKLKVQLAVYERDVVAA